MREVIAARRVAVDPLIAADDAQGTVAVAVSVATPYGAKAAGTSRAQDGSAEAV